MSSGQDQSFQQYVGYLWNMWILHNLIRIVSMNCAAYNQRDRCKCLSWPVCVSTARGLAGLTSTLSSSFNHKQSDSQAEVLNKSSKLEIISLSDKGNLEENFCKFPLDCIPYIKARTITELHRTTLVCTETYKCDLTTCRNNIRASSEARPDKGLSEDKGCDEETGMDNNVERMCL